MLLCLVTFAWLQGGCIEVLTALDVLEPGAADGIAPPGGDESEPDALDSDGIPEVSLSTSNASPPVDDPVTLTCRLKAGSEQGITYDFQPRDGRIDIDSTGGTARFTASESDADSPFTYTCSATNIFGTSDDSNTVTIIPTE